MAQVEACPIDASIGESLSNGDADIAIGLIPDLDAGFYQRVLYEQGWVTIMRAGHPLTVLSGADFMAAEHAQVLNGTGQPLLRAAIAAQGPSPRIGLSLPGVLGLPSVLNSSDLIATLPHQIGHMLAKQAGLSAVDCPIPVARFQVKLYWHARFHADPESAWLRDCAVAVLAGI